MAQGIRHVESGAAGVGTLEGTQMTVYAVDMYLPTSQTIRMPRSCGDEAAYEGDSLS